MRLIFMGTPEFAVPALIELAARGHDIAAVYTRAPKPGGRRGLELTPSPVEREARKLGLEVHTPSSLKGEEAAAAFRAHNADAAVVVAYGLLLPKAILDAPRLGCFNIHASLLPRWRGAAPIHRAIMAGDEATGVTIMKMDEGLDTGDMAMVDRVAIGADVTTGDMHDVLALIGADAMARALDALGRDTLTLTKQPADGVTYAEKVRKEEARIDWTLPWNEVHNHIRALSPTPGAWFEVKGVRVKALRSTRGVGSGPPAAVLDDHLTIACGEGSVRLNQVQRAGKKPMSAEEFLRGTPLAPDRGNDRQSALRRNLVSLAKAIVTDQMSLPDGCTRISNIILWLRPFEQIHYQDLDKYLDAIRDLPHGPERQHWNREALKPYDAKLEASNNKYRERILNACHDIIRRFGSPSDSSAVA